jgi:spoIIIJ-associated protein
MEWVETTGKTIEEAKEAALDELGVDEQDAEFEVLEEPKVGLFGRVRSEGRIRARVRPTTPRAKEDRRDRRRRTKAADPAAVTATATEAVDAAAVATTPVAGTKTAPRSRRAVATPPATDGDADTAPSRESTGGPRTNPSRRRGSRTAGVPDAGNGTLVAASAAAPSASDTDADTPASRPPRRRGPRARPADDRTDEEEVTGMDVALDEQGKVAEQFLHGLLERFGRTAAITLSQPDDDTLDIQLQGEDLGLLIGPKGATLLAIQDLTRTAVQRKTGAGNGRIHVDVGGYRQKRSEALARFAEKVAGDVLASGTRIALEPMSAPDRKVVHDALTDVAGVQTISEGEDAQRRVVILPADD